MTHTVRLLHLSKTLEASRSQRKSKHLTENLHSFGNGLVVDNCCCEQMIPDCQKTPDLPRFLVFFAKNSHRGRVTGKADVEFVYKKNGAAIKNDSCHCPGWDFVGLMFYTVSAHGKNCACLCILSSRWYQSSRCCLVQTWTLVRILSVPVKHAFVFEEVLVLFLLNKKTFRDPGLGLG